MLESDRLSKPIPRHPGFLEMDGGAAKKLAQQFLGRGIYAYVLFVPRKPGGAGYAKVLYGNPVYLILATERGDVIACYPAQKSDRE